MERLNFGKPLSFYPKRKKAELTNEDIALKHSCFSDFRLFTHEFFSGHIWGEFSEMHEDLIKIESNPLRRGAKEAWAAPRGNAKTVFRGLIKTVHSLVYAYQPFTVIIGFSSTEAEGKVKDIRDELLNNEKLIRVFGAQLKGKPGIQSFITTQNCMVLARGRGGQVRGLRHGLHRPTRILCDDVEDLESCQSPAQREKVKQWFFKDVMFSIQSGSEFEGNVELIGTILHEDALLPDLLKNPTWTKRKYQSVESWAIRQDLWDQWAVLYNDLNDPDSDKTALAFYNENEKEMLEGTKVLWPAGESYYKLMVQRLSMGEASFSSEKQNDPFDPERQILHPEKCKRFRLRWEGDGTFTIVFPEEEIHSSRLKIIGFHDPAMSENKKSDYAAISVCGQDERGFIYALECWAGKVAPDAQIKQAIKLYLKWGMAALYFEAIAFQKLLKQPYNDEIERTAKELSIDKSAFALLSTGVSGNKEHRIGMLEPYFENGVISLNQDINPLLIDQCRLFPTADHDDCPDSLYGCVEKLKRPRNLIAIGKGGSNQGVL